MEFRDSWYVDDIGVVDDGCCNASCEAQPFLNLSHCICLHLLEGGCGYGVKLCMQELKRVLRGNERFSGWFSVSETRYCSVVVIYCLHGYSYERGKGQVTRGCTA